jgi:ribonuclease HII
VYCDKHGGRNRYQAILTHCFDEEWFDIEIESRGCSRYKAKWAQHEMGIQFMVDGDSIFPSAAASIIAKWTREELMNRLNGFWQTKVVGGIKPTAGYYVDAMRFANQIDEAVEKLGLERDQWWRKK